MLRWLLFALGLVVVAILIGAGVAWYVNDDDTVLVHVTTSSTTVVDDRAERDELLALMRKSVAATWWVNGEFRRTIAGGRSITGTAFQVNRPPDHLSGSGGVITGVLGGETISCSQVEAGYSCAKRQPAPAEEADDDPAAYLAYVTSDRLHWYTVSRLPSMTVQGTRAACFRLNHRGNLPDPLGQRREFCFTKDGVPARQLEERGPTVTELTTTSFTTTVTDADLDQLASSEPPTVTTTSSSTTSTTTPSTTTKKSSSSTTASR